MQLCVKLEYLGFAGVEISKEMIYHEFIEHLLKLSQMTLSAKESFQEQLKQVIVSKHSTFTFIPQLRAYQLQGAQWLSVLYLNSYNGILADEMGLGKTIQAIAFLTWLKEHLKEKQNVNFLVIVPLSLAHNWKSEIQRFSPLLEVVVFTSETRHAMKAAPFDILLTTYETANIEIDHLKTFHWDYMIIDEAHRLKNKDSLLHRNLASLDSPRKLLLTGTPIQNNLLELFALLKFCNPDLFTANDTEFASWFKTSKEYEQLSLIIKPFLLRRLKSQVANLPELKHIVIKTALSHVQHDLYKSILSKNYSLFENINKTGLMNVIMQLRKCTNHPYLFRGIEPEPFVTGEHLIQSSGKLIILDQLLKHLKERNHRVLIFSQMTQMLDILQDFLDLREFSYQRLDGSIRGSDRNEAVQTFQSTETFVFLLSTRAGGVGLNLTAADTVIFIDNDFNPTQDEQAAARIHRIGQLKKTKVIRLICEHTVDEVIWKRAQKKLEISRQILKSNEISNEQSNETFSDQEMLNILCYGLDKLSNSSDSIENANIQLYKILEDSDDIIQTEEMNGSENIYSFNGLDYKEEAKAFLHANLDIIQDKSTTIETSNKRRKKLSKKDKWEKAGYISKAISDLVEENTIDFIEKAKLEYVTGDIGIPKILPTCKLGIIAHVVDNTGYWSDRGVFAVINKLDPSIAEGYKISGSREIQDLDLGSTHIYKLSDILSVALLVAQETRNELDTKAFEESLDKLSAYAKASNGSVHFSRLNYQNQPWYQIERLISKCLNFRGIETVVYYKKPQRKEIDKQISIPLFPDKLYGMTYFIDINDVALYRQVKRRIIAYGGECMADINDKVTHILQQSINEKFKNKNIVYESMDQFIKKIA